MRLVKLMSFVVTMILFWGCSSGIKVTTDLDESVDFNKYKSYSFLGWQNDSDKILGDFDKKRIRDAFKNEFESRNLHYVESGGDMTVSLFIVVNQETSVTGYTDYYGGGYGRYGRYGGGWGGTSTTTYTENDYLVGTLVMDVFDEISGDQIWQGIAKKTLTENPEKREKTIPKSINAMMYKFPIKPVK